MVRSTFGGTDDDFVSRFVPFGGLQVLAAATNVECTFWSAQVGGTQYTSLLDENNVAVTSIRSDDLGFLPQFQGPDAVLTLWVDAGTKRRRLVARDITGVQDAVASASASATSAANSAASAAAAGTATDTGVAGMVNDSLSQTNAALKTLIASQAGTGDVSTAELDAALATLRTQVPSLEELKVDVIINFPAEANPINLVTGTTREMPIFGAAFPCRILSLDFWWNATVDADAAAYINVKIERTLASGTENLVGQQSTAQKAIVTDNHWSFSQPLDETYRVLPTGAHLGLQFETVGDPPGDLNGPHLVTIRYARA